MEISLFGCKRHIAWCSFCKNEKGQIDFAFLGQRRKALTCQKGKELNKIKCESGRDKCTCGSNCKMFERELL
jgi:hypothetical protein